MHMMLVILGGIALFGVFFLFGWLWGEDSASVAVAAKAFIPLWLAMALVNMSVGVTKAGYTVMQELPIFVIVVTIPAAIAAIAVWQIARA